MHIIKANVNNLDDIMRLNRIVQDLHVRNEPDKFIPFDEVSVREYLLDAFSNPAITFLMAIDDDKQVVGYVMLHAQERNKNAYSLPRQFLELEQIAVDPHFRKRGIGSALVEEAFAFAKSSGISELELSVWQFNDEAQKLFHSKGFAPSWQRMRNTRK